MTPLPSEEELDIKPGEIYQSIPQEPGRVIEHLPNRLYPDMYQDVRDFMEKFTPQMIRPFPGWPSFEVMRLRYALVKEECGIELENAIGQGNVPEVIDAIADSIYVLLGMAVSMGVDIRPIWVAVHRANMAKEGGPTRADGKILKPDGWVAPDVSALLMLQVPDTDPLAG